MSLRERRVVVTGVAGISPLGNDWQSIYAQLRACRNAVRRMPKALNRSGASDPDSSIILCFPPAFCRTKDDSSPVQAVRHIRAYGAARASAR